MAMGWDKYSIATCGGHFWWIGIEFGREFGLEGGERSLEFCALSGALHLGISHIDL